VQCPACAKSVEPVPIVFGYPSAELFEAAERHEVVLGGCVVYGDEPDARCPECGADIRLEGDLPAGAPSQVGRRISLRRERDVDDQRFLDAWVDASGALHIEGQDLGPSTAPVSDDGEYEWVPHRGVPALNAGLTAGEVGLLIGGLDGLSSAEAGA